MQDSYCLKVNFVYLKMYFVNSNATTIIVFKYFKYVLYIYISKRDKIEKLIAENFF